MSKEVRIAILKARQRLLMKRGPHNSHIVAKIQRRIRALEIA